MLEEIPEVIEAYLVSGDYDYYIRIAVRDTRDYERLLREKLYRIPGIRHSKSSFVLRRLKQSLIPLEATMRPRRASRAPRSNRYAAKRHGQEKLHPLPERHLAAPLDQPEHRIRRRRLGELSLRIREVDQQVGRHGLTLDPLEHRSEAGPAPTGQFARQTSRVPMR